VLPNPVLGVATKAREAMTQKEYKQMQECIWKLDYPEIHPCASSSVHQPLCHNLYDSAYTKLLLRGEFHVVKHHVHVEYQINCTASKE
jgi:hypothetical protein